MRTSMGSRSLMLTVSLILVFSGIGMAYNPQGPGQTSTPEVVEEANTAVAAGAVLERPDWLAAPPVLSPAQQASLEYWSDQTNLPGPALSGSDNSNFSSLSLDPSSQSSLGERPRSQAPLAPGTASIYRNTVFSSTIPSGLKSNVMEASVGVGGLSAWFTGNWFAARSINGGFSWTYSSAYAGYPDFCCDQVTLYDESRNMLLWLRQGSPDASRNSFKLSVSADYGMTFWTYTIVPTNVNSLWTNNWFDYPNVQLGADYLYITFNMFNTKGTPGTTDDTWVRSVVLRWPLDPLRTGAGFGYFRRQPFSSFAPEAHYLPTGLTEVRQMWLDVKITDANGKVILRSGAVDKNGNIDENAVMYHTYLGNEKGEQVLNVAKADRIIYDHRIPPKGYAVENYAFYIPDDAVSPISVEVTLKYRSAAQSLAKTLLGDGAPEIPIIDMTGLSEKIEFQR